MQRLPPRPVVGHAAVAFGELESLSLAFGSPVEGVPEVGRISLEDVFLGNAERKSEILWDH
eukprot:1384096-Amorphochlora_amoeboformis.AAC.1